VGESAAMANGDYCSFMKAVEHLGDRWSLVIVRDLFRAGPLGFNSLASGLPGISRSVLAARLRKLQDLGIVERADDGRTYRLAYAGRAMEPILQALRTWSERFVPEDPAMVERDPDIVLMWLARRIDPTAVPAERSVIELDLRGAAEAKRSWLVVERGQAVSVCVADPSLATDRYVFVSSDVHAIDRVARGLRPWRAEVADGSIEVAGNPSLVRAIGSWLRPRPELAPAPAPATS
jgi:DNA-binding HxlR family transcriptional regulator